MLFRAKKINHHQHKKNKIINSLRAKIRGAYIPGMRSSFGGKVSQSTSSKGSLTVESAFVLPLFFLCICTLICFMDIYRIQEEKLTKLCQDAMEAGMFAYTTDMTDDLIRRADYRYQPPISVVSLPAVYMSNVVKVHPWTGYHGTNGATITNEEMVYVTETGSVYHRSAGCTYLKLSIQIVSSDQLDSLRNDSGAKYYACEKCVRTDAPAASVYITSKGNRYHNLASCSGLKRTVRLVKISEVHGMRVCSRCGGS